MAALLTLAEGIEKAKENALADAAKRRAADGEG